MSENSFDIDKSYVSEYDLFLNRFDKDYPQKSASQQQEIDKHARIAELRDKAQWDDEKDT